MDDCNEIYLSKPIDEYNIMEKIKEANKELFALESINTNKTDDSAASISNKKVKFAISLETDEPKDIIEKTNGGNLKEDDKKEEDNVEGHLENDVANERKTEALSLATSREDKVASEKRINGDMETLCDKMQRSMEMNKGSDLDPGQGQKSRKKFLKQSTFDFGNDYCPNESDNQIEFTNSDAEVERKLDNEDNNTSNIENVDNIDGGDNDDILSILVASYIPDNFRNGEIKRGSSHQTNKPRTNVFERSPINKSGSGTYLPPPEVTTLKFNYRMCCEYRHARQEKLPKYTGYLSEYGLSHKQFAEKEKKLRRHRRTILEKGLQASEEELRRMQDNERVFIKWLKRKMRFPPNKTRNMYDTRNYSRIRE